MIFNVILIAFILNLSKITSSQTTNSTHRNDLYLNGIWVDYTPGHRIPHDAVPGGFDDLGTLYVARANLTIGRGQIKTMVGKYSVGSKAAYVTHGHREYKVDGFQILRHKNWKWTKKEDSEILIPGANDQFICRGKFLAYWINGKYDIVNIACYYSFWGKEIRSSYFQFLTRKKFDDE